MLHNATNTFISTLARLGGRFLAILDPMRDGQCRENPETLLLDTPETRHSELRHPANSDPRSHPTKPKSP